VTTTQVLNNSARTIGKSSQDLGNLLAEVSALAVRLRQKAKVSSKGDADFPAAEHAVLEILDRQSQATVPEIAWERSTSRQNIQILIDRLARESLVELVGNPAHKRSALVRLTAQGKEALTAARRSQNDWLEELSSALSGSEIGAAASVLRRIHRLLSGVSERVACVENVTVEKRNEGSSSPIAPTEPIEHSTEEEEFPLHLL